MHRCGRNARPRMPRRWAPLAFPSRIEAAYRGFAKQKHAQMDPLGYCFLVAWCFAAAARYSSLLSSWQQATVAGLAAAALTAAALQQLAPAAYLRHRNPIVCGLRLAMTIAAAATQPLAVQASRHSSATDVWAFVLLHGGQHLLLAFCTFAWRLRAQWHLPLQLACICVAAAGNGRMVAVLLAAPGAASTVACSMAVLWPAAEAAVSPATAIAALCTVLQVQLGFHAPSSLLVAAEVSERAEFLSAYMLQTAASFQSGSYALGMRQASRSDGSLDRLMQRLAAKPSA